MSVPRFFVDRPIFAAVLSIVITLVGALAYWALPVAQYPEVAPPTVIVTASYPGADASVLATNVTLLSGYLFGCHSMRHIAGGCVDRLSQAPLGQRTYDCVSCLNRRHMLWAWTSLCAVGVADLYVRLCSMGVWSDVRIF